MFPEFADRYKPGPGFGQAWFAPLFVDAAGNMAYCSQVAFMCHPITIQVPSAAVVSEESILSAIADREQDQNRPSRVEKRVQAFHDRVIEAARDLFTERGVEATKIDDICEAADVAKRTLCNHFPTKTHIVQELSRRSIVDFVERIQDAQQKGETTAERLRLLFNGFATQTLEQGPVNRELVGELFNVAHASEMGGESEVRVSDAVRALLEAGGPEQLPVNATVESFAEIVLGSIYVSMLEWIHRDDYDFELNIHQKGEFLASLLPEHLLPEDQE